ncbi:MAG: HU family DNA-binding protein [bacterium]|nr:HU family DNA-binding protein [bacterium]
MAKMTKAQVIASLAEKIGMSKADTKRYLDSLYDLAISEVKKNGQFVVGNLGKLVKVNRAERMGRNPATGESIKIPAKTVVKFRVAKAVKEAVM